MGLLDYYRQFEGVPEEEVNRELREEAAERRRKALTRVATLDLSQTTWPDLPHANISSAITFTARRGLQRYPHLRGSELRGELAERHEVPVERLIIGNGAAELLSSATRALIEPGQELMTSWPSYPLYPIMARRAHGRAVPVERWRRCAAERGARATDARVVALASPNDPTGELLTTGELERLLAGLPEGVAVLLDEALVEFSDAQPHEARWRCWRTTRACWSSAVSPRPGAWRASASATRSADPARRSYSRSSNRTSASARSRSRVRSRRCARASTRSTHHVHSVREERARLRGRAARAALRRADSQANFLWVAHPELDGSELATRLRQAGVLVAAGAPLGEPHHVRIALRNPPATERLLSAIDKALAQAA